MAAQLAAAAGRFDEGSRAASARANAALVADLTKRGAWDTKDDQTPRAVGAAAIAATRGHTAGMGGSFSHA